MERKGMNDWRGVPRATDETPIADPAPYPGTPRWVKVSGIVVGILALLAGIMVLGSGGRHGPLRHITSGHAVGLAPFSSVAEFQIPLGGAPGHLEITR